MRFRFVTYLLLTISVSAAAAACSGGAEPIAGNGTTTTNDAGGTELPGTEEEDASKTTPDPTPDAGSDVATSSALNPYGVPYPADNIGWKARKGTTRGQRIANLSFQGYAPNKPTLGTVSLVDLYDPQTKTHDAIFVVVGAAWDAFSKATLDTLKKSTKRIATLAVLGEGTSPGMPATLTHLSTWRGLYPWATTALDTSFTTFAPTFDATAVPYVMVLDARTMEISYASLGGFTTVPTVDEQVTAITGRAAAY